METEKMTIHRALAELKLLDARIVKSITEIQPLGIYQKDKDVNGVIPKEKFDLAAKSNYDSTIALIDRKLTIKSAIVKANAETMVKVGDKNMTIADAITFKSVIALKRQFVNALKSHGVTITGQLNKGNEKANENVQLILQASFGKDNVKVSKEDVESITKPYLAANEWHLADPLDLTAKIESLDREIDSFETEVDAVLSEINAVTFIEI